MYIFNLFIYIYIFFFIILITFSFLLFNHNYMIFISFFSLSQFLVSIYYNVNEFIYFIYFIKFYRSFNLKFPNLINIYYKKKHTYNLQKKKK
jgi:hypothetical protein